MNLASIEIADAFRGLTLSLSGLIAAFILTGFLYSLQARKLDAAEASRVPQFELFLFVLGYLLIVASLSILSYQRLGKLQALVPEIYLATTGLIVNVVAIGLLVKNAHRRRNEFRRREAALAAQVKKETIKELVGDALAEEKEWDGKERRSD